MSRFHKLKNITEERKKVIGGFSRSKYTNELYNDLYVSLLFEVNNLNFDRKLNFLFTHILRVA